ncbi:guanosine-diphosphatase [Ephemerocybe angulata]|uniref:guanosine-diphosphatase n=1 Tax=Ephemerocybe angulata TaxID=980116 RepID=A0A8H6HLF3_9AGAR|nr:guanosine-diphosphatase [Tulosesus angulatus]
MAMAAMNMISPRSGNYDRLEGGMGPSRTGEAKKGWRRFGWKKFAIGAAVLLFVVWLWGPRERRFDWKEVGSKVKEGLGGKPADVLVPPIHHEEEYPSTKSPSKGAPKSPLSFETDPDPSKTSFCEKPHDPASHLVQFALMIDAGSTGSRIHVYKFNNCKASPQYEYEVFKMNQPGLSSFAGRPLAAAKSLDELLDLAVKVVPEDLHHCTPVAVKATAGLRLLPGRQSHDILEAVENRIRKKYDFQLPAKDGVVIMDGKDEGVYAWITANYLLGTLSAAKPTAGVKEKKADTYAVLDLGGASTQIVFEPNFTPAHAEGRLEEGEHKYELDFGGRKYELYQHSYLGYGLMRARRHVHRLVDFMATIRPGAPERHHQHDHDHDEPEVVPNPCLARHTERRVEITDEGVSGEAWNVTMSGGDVGSFEACERVVQLVLAKDAVCELKPCSFNGVYQPSLLDSFQNGKVLLLSYFYDRLAPLLPPASAEPLSVDSFASTAKAMCGGPDAWAKQSHWIGNKELMDEIHGRPEWCLDLTFMHGLLRMGYEFEDTRRIDIGKKIRNTELGWCLGATISMVSGGELTCKA